MYFHICNISHAFLDFCLAFPAFPDFHWFCARISIPHSFVNGITSKIDLDIKNLHLTVKHSFIKFTAAQWKREWSFQRTASLQNLSHLSPVPRFPLSNIHFYQKRKWHPNTEINTDFAYAGQWLPKIDINRDFAYASQCCDIAEHLRLQTLYIKTSSSEFTCCASLYSAMYGVHHIICEFWHPSLVTKTYAVVSHHLNWSICITAECDFTSLWTLGLVYF